MLNACKFSAEFTFLVAMSVCSFPGKWGNEYHLNRITWTIVSTSTRCRPKSLTTTFNITATPTRIKGTMRLARNAIIVLVSKSFHIQRLVCWTQLPCCSYSCAASEAAHNKCWLDDEPPTLVDANLKCWALTNCDTQARVEGCVGPEKIH